MIGGPGGSSFKNGSARILCGNIESFKRVIGLNCAIFEFHHDLGNQTDCWFLLASPRDKIVRNE
jgi:hypothetical protein